MKIFEITWNVPSNSTMGIYTGISTSNKKAFGTKEKATEFYKKLHEAASLLCINIQCTVDEVELE